jgi:hypothetical protein
VGADSPLQRVAGTRGGEYAGPCPFCGGHDRLRVQPEAGLWWCRQCSGEHWQDAIAYVQRRDGVDFAEACTRLGAPSDRGANPPARSHRARSRAAARRVFALPPDEPSPAAPATATSWRPLWEATCPLADTPGAAYVEGRGIPLAGAIAAGVRWAARWYGRPAVVFPIVDRAGRLVAATSRFADGREDPKVQTAGPKSLGVFEACPGALQASPLVVTEAALDALALAACGVPAIAFGGTTPPRWFAEHVALRPVLIALDNDVAGDAATAKLAPSWKRLGASCERLRSAPWKDWAEAIAAIGREALTMMLARALAPELPGGPLWWELPPWNGQISDAEHRAVVERYIQHFDYYTSDLPLQHPALLSSLITSVL